MKPRHLLERGWAIIGAVSVRTKIMGIALGLVLLFGLGTTLYVRAALTTALTTQLEEQSVTISRDLAARSTDLILLNDIYSLQRLLLETQTNDPSVRYAFIVDRQGYVLAHTFASGFPANLLEINSVNPEEHHHTVVLETNEGLIWDTAVPIFGGRAGTVRVGFSDLEMRKSLNSVTGQLILITVLVSAIGITAAALLTWILTRPILELARATERIAAGDFTPRIRRWADDEIGNLAEAFNHMTAELARTDE
ncbi:MAG: ATPase, partial [Anaerolinea sp.]|nr:ATPase [Anaerolinea sp.]